MTRPEKEVVTEAWRIEIDRRVREIGSGAVQCASAEEAVREGAR